MSESRLNGSSKLNSASLILGTAGHIDHGKSALILALTGTDPDRLEEEKRRGITIQLGFARLDLPSGRSMGVVDVPGHERFVRQMVAGATGVDVALLVIAADDGIMPQTVEHLAVLEVLGVKRLLVALTKIDLVDPEWVLFMQEEIASYMAKTPYAGCTIVPCSSRTREGLDELVGAIDTLARDCERIHDVGPMRMPIDRAFTIKGFGTVITGTLWSGSVAVGATLELLPGERKTRVRSIQIHGSDVEQAYAGNRVALCLADIDLEDVHPGDFLCEPGSVHLSSRFDARFEYLDPFSSGIALPSGETVRIAHGTREVQGRILSLEGLEAFPPPSSNLVQVRLDEELPVTYQDRFIVRLMTPARVIGGGGVLNAHPRRRSNLSASDEEQVRALDRNDVAGAVGTCVRASTCPLRTDLVIDAIGLPEALVRPCLVDLACAQDIACFSGNDTIYLGTKACVQRLQSAIEKALLQFHTQEPDRSGIDKATLRKLVCCELDQACFDQILDRCPQAVVSGGLVAHKTAGASVAMRQQAAADALMAVYRAAGAWPQSAQASIEAAGLDAKAGAKALGDLERAGKLVHYAPDSYMDTDVIQALRETVRTWLTEHGSGTAAELKDAMGTTRKYAMPLLEYFDATGLTLRSDTIRTLAPTR